MAEYENVGDELDAIIGGNFTVVEDDENHDDADVDEIDGADDDVNLNDEDTDHSDDSDDGTETNDDAAEQDQDTDESEDDDDEENTLVDTNGSEEEDTDDDVDEGEENESSDDSDTASKEDVDSDEDGTDTDDEADGADSETTDTVDYKSFYEQVAGVKFKANGKDFEGFTDPKKIIQAQQMAYNYSEKMAGFKQYRPYMGPLKERGMLDDPTKFDLAMSLIDGDQEALKKHINDLGIDPIELDMDNISYVQEAKSTSRDTIAIEDALSSARSAGVEDKVYNAVMKQWDDDSFRDFVNTPAIQTDLIQHMSDGSYEIVVGKMEQMGILDPSFTSMKNVDQYKAAVRELVSEDGQRQAALAQKAAAESAQAAQKVEAGKVAEASRKVEADKIATAKADKASKAKYAATVEKKNKVAEDARKKASKASKKKPGSTKRAKVDPMSLSGEEVSTFLENMIMGKK